MQGFPRVWESHPDDLLNISEKTGVFHCCGFNKQTMKSVSGLRVSGPSASTLENTVRLFIAYNNEATTSPIHIKKVPLTEWSPSTCAWVRQSQTVVTFMNEYVIEIQLLVQALLSEEGLKQKCWLKWR